MKPRRLPWKRLLLLLVGGCLVGIALLPWLIGDSSGFGDRLAEKLARWTRGEVHLTGPVELHYFPEISVTSGIEMQSEDAALPAKLECDNAKIALSLPHLLLGRLAIESVSLNGPEMTFTQPRGAAPEGWGRAEAAMVKLVGHRPFHVLRIKDGTVRFDNPISTDRIEALNIKLDLGDAGERTDGYGNFIWRGEPVRFTYDTGLNAQTIRTASSTGAASPLRFTIESAPLTAKLNGTVQFDKGFQLEGQMSATLANLEDFLLWTGLTTLQGVSAKDLSAAGNFRLSDGMLVFDGGRFSMDGNAATGLLAVSLEGERPRVEATLAFDRLDLDPYVGGALEESADPQSPADSAATDIASASFLDWPLLNRADADLRLSANAVSVQGRELGGGAFTIAAKDGVVIGDIADLAICGGNASARFILDLSAPTRNADFTASLDQIDITPCLALLALDMPVRGTAVVKGHFKASGQDWDDILKRLDGDVQLTAENGGLPVDIGSLMSEDAPIERVGWQSEPATAFGSLNANCRIGAAEVWCQRFSMEIPQGSVSGSGRIDFGDDQLDWTILLPAALASTDKEQTDAAQALRQVVIRGPLRDPVISRDSRNAPESETLLGVTPSTQPITPN